MRYQVVKAWFRDVWHVYAAGVWLASFISEGMAQKWSAALSPGSFGRWPAVPDAVKPTRFATGGVFYPTPTNKIRGPGDPGYRSGGDAFAKEWDKIKAQRTAAGIGCPKPAKKIGKKGNVENYNGVSGRVYHSHLGWGTAENALFVDPGLYKICAAVKFDYASPANVPVGQLWFERPFMTEKDRTSISWEQSIGWCGKCGNCVSLNLSGFPYSCIKSRCPIRLLSAERKEIIAAERKRLSTVQLRSDEWFPGHFKLKDLGE